MIRPGFIACAEAPMTAALRGARSFRSLRAAARGDHAAVREARLPVGRDPAPVRRQKQRVDLELFERRITERIVGRIERKILERVSSETATSSSTSGACAWALLLSKKIFSAGLFSTAAWRPCFTSPGRRIAVEAPPERLPYHSVRTPPRPNRRTGPNAGSCLKERSASAAGVPEAGTSLSRTRIPERDGFRCAAADVLPHRPRRGHETLEIFFENENPPTSDLWARCRARRS